mmetsp:Transcript_110652/g.207360  ORF Transcript_110652/g.207360 Transcript_110652/m.207360 type:complete len:232 (+) Transcript_110652:252-947(+)
MNNANDTIDGHTHLNRKIASHQQSNARAVGFNKTRACGGHRSRHLLWQPICSRLLVRVGCGLHVSKLRHGLLIQVVIRSCHHHLGLPTCNRVHRYGERLHCSGTSTYRCFDRPGAGQQEHINPCGGGVDEGLLKDITLHALSITHLTLQEHLPKCSHATDTRSQAIAHLRNVDVLVEFVWVGDARIHERLDERDKCEQSDTVNLIDDVIWDAIQLGIPSSRHLCRHPAVTP